MAAPKATRAQGFKIAFLSSDSNLEAYLCEKRPASSFLSEDWRGIGDYVAKPAIFFKEFGSSIWPLSLTLNLEP